MTALEGGKQMNKKNEKPVLFDLDNIRVVKSDDRNVTVEEFEFRKGPHGKEDVPTWSFVGHYQNVCQALVSIQRKELLIDCKAISDISSLEKQVQESERKIIEAIKQVQA